MKKCILIIISVILTGSIVFAITQYFSRIIVKPSEVLITQEKSLCLNNIKEFSNEFNKGEYVNSEVNGYSGEKISNNSKDYLRVTYIFTISNKSLIEDYTTTITVKSKKIYKKRILFYDSPLTNIIFKNTSECRYKTIVYLNIKGLNKREKEKLIRNINVCIKFKGDVFKSKDRTKLIDFTGIKIRNNNLIIE